MATYKYLTEQGIIVPDTQSVNTDVQGEWKANFGQGLSVEEATIQGRIIELIALERKNTMGVVAENANMLDPNNAYGIYLDAIASYFGVFRKEGKRSTINLVRLTGVPSSTATGTITISVNPIDGVSVYVGNDTYTFGATGISIGANPMESATNLANAINANANSTVSATSSGEIITLNAKAVQNYGNTTPMGWGSANTNDETVYITLSGSSLSGGTVIIPAGSQAQTDDGFIFALNSDVSIGTSGIASGTFIAVLQGEIIVAEGALNKILTPIAGWETIYNTNIATKGYLNQPDDSFRKEYKVAAPKYSQSFINSIGAALYEVEGLQSAFVYENTTNLPQTNADNTVIPVGETVLPHGIMVVVYGANSTGDFDQLVAQAIQNKRSTGAPMSLVADTAYQKTITIKDQYFQVPYDVKFSYAKELPIFVRVNVSNINYGGEVSTAVKQVLSDWFASNLAINAEYNSIGKNISSFELSSVISANLPVYVRSCTIGLSPTTLSTNEIVIPMTQIATTTTNNIVVELS